MMAYDLPDISASLYESTKKAHPGKQFPEILKTLMASGTLEETRFPSATASRIQLQHYCTDRNLIAGAEKIFNDIALAPDCIGKDAFKLKRALIVILTNLVMRHFSTP